jgi:hypothetical protein
MRTTSIIVVVFGLTGCVAVVGESRGVTQKQHAGTVSVVFTNASPDKMCGLHMSFDNEQKYGDNWLPAEGLPSGKSIELKMKPGKYKANWNTCKTGAKPYYAGTLCSQWAFTVKEPIQLFAYIADAVAPTKRAGPVDSHRMVKFVGQPIGPTTGLVAEVSPESPQADDTQVAATNDAPAVKFDASQWNQWIDQKEAVAHKRTAATTNKAMTKPMTASLRRTHNVADAQINYVKH